MNASASWQLIAPIADRARGLVDDGCDLMALAQVSMARATEASEMATGVRVLSAVDSAVRALRQRLLANDARARN